METKFRPKLKPAQYFSVKQKHVMIQDFLNGGMNKQQVWKKYTGDEKEKGKLLKFMRQLGYIDGDVVKKPISFYMGSKPKTSKAVELPPRDEGQFKLQKVLEELKDSRMREQAYLLMIEVAEKELKINIRKKSFTR